MLSGTGNLLRTATDVLLGDVKHISIYHVYITAGNCYVPGFGGVASASHWTFFFNHWNEMGDNLFQLVMVVSGALTLWAPKNRWCNG